MQFTKRPRNKVIIDNEQNDEQPPEEQSAQEFYDNFYRSMTYAGETNNFMGKKNGCDHRKFQKVFKKIIKCLIISCVFFQDNLRPITQIFFGQNNVI